jgi:parallel beta-helix repeat protein
LPIPSIVKADSNPPQFRNNGWWNTTSGFDWIINTTGNLWDNKNISVTDSIQIINGGSLTLQNCTLLVNGNISVGYNASLTLINTTIKFNSSSNGTSELLVKSGGSLYISDYDNNSKTSFDGSNITSNITDNKHRFVFFISKRTNFTMINSEVHHCGFSQAPNLYGVYVKAENSSIENNIFSNNFAGMIIESSNNTIRNNKFINNDEYGLLIILGRNNTLNNNTINNNRYNFGLLLNDINQNNNITLDNTLLGKTICYLEKISGIIVDTGYTNASFVGIVNSSNLIISNQELTNNFNGVFLLGVNDSIIENTNISNNYYGLFANCIGNITLFDCNISNNNYSGFELVNLCKDLKIINSTIIDNFIGIVASDSNVTIINTTFQNSTDNDIYLKTNSDIYTLNCTINNSNIKFGTGTSKLVVKHFLNIQTKNHTGYPIGNVSLSIYDGNNKLVTTGKSDANGFLSWIPCTSYILDKTGIYDKMSNHRILAEYAGLDFIENVNISSLKEVVIDLNHPPIITNPLPKVVFVPEDSTFSHDFNGFDQDFDNISWDFKTNALWLVDIDELTGIINGTPTDHDIGTFFLNVTCNDSYNGFNSFNFSIVVNNTNDKPRIISKAGSGIAYEDNPYIHDFNVTDPDIGDIHNWSMKTDAQWLYPIHKSLGRIFGFPNQKHVGEYYVNVSCYDKLGALDSYNFTLEVYPVNDQPIIVNPIDGIIEVKEDLVFYYNFEFFDQDKENVTWSSHTNAKWLNEINSSTGELSGTPGDFDVGQYFVNVSCIDPNKSSTYHNFTIKVRNTNDPPVFIEKSEQPELIFTNEDEYFEYTLKISDPDKNDNFKFSIDTEFFKSSLPGSKRSKDISWLQLTSNNMARTCTIFGIPTNDHVGLVMVNITVEDSAEANDHIIFSIRINNTNDPPTIINPISKIVYVMEDTKFYYDFDFIDIDGDSVFWLLKTNAPWINEIDNSTGEVSGIPKQEDLAMDYYVQVKCKDPFGETDIQNFTIIVNNTNDPPIILNPCPKIVYVLEDTPYRYEFKSIDKDSKNVYWSSKTNATWLNQIEVFIGEINGIPLDNDIGYFYVNISCRDESNEHSYFNYTIIVNNTNDRPIIKNGYLAPVVVGIGEAYFFKFRSFDADSDPVTWKIESNSSKWLDFEDITGILTGTPTRFDVGIYYVNISCYDQYDEMDYFEYQIQVRGIYNRLPELLEGHVDPKKGSNNTYFSFFVTYVDNDGDEPYAVFVKIDDEPYMMEPIIGDDVKDGVVYSYSTFLENGNHTYYFQAIYHKSKRAASSKTIRGEL